MSINLDPQYICGFVDGEGNFHVAVYKDPRMKTGMKFIPEFHVSQRVSSKYVLDSLVDYFECGYVKANHAKNHRDKTYVYVVRDRQDLLIKIIPFFEKYSLKTEKKEDFRIFADIVRQMNEGKHRDPFKAKDILSLAYMMNQGGRYRKKRYKF